MKTDKTAPSFHCFVCHLADLTVLQKHMLWVIIRKTLLMSTHNECFCGEIRKLSILFQVKKVSYLELWIMDSSYLHDGRDLVY